MIQAPQAQKELNFASWVGGDRRSCYGNAPTEIEVVRTKALPIKIKEVEITRIVCELNVDIIVWKEVVLNMDKPENEIVDGERSEEEPPQMCKPERER